MIKGIIFNPDFALEIFKKGTEIKTHDGRILTVVEGIPSNYMGDCKSIQVGFSDGTIHLYYDFEEDFTIHFDIKFVDEK